MAGIEKTKIRDSNFELLRLVCQFYIILYHICLYFIYPSANVFFFKAIQMSLHIGVVDYVLISGYYTIKPSSRGLLRFMMIFLVYSIPEIVVNISQSQDFKHIIKSTLFVSRSHFWFVKTYLYLYLLSPILNQHIQHSTKKQRLFVICSLLFIAIYIGSLRGDISLISGKNVVNFILIYLIGNLISRNKEYLTRISVWYWGISYIILNVTIIILYVLCSDNMLGKIIWITSFPYCSPILMVNSLLFFMIFFSFNFKSKFINWIAKSSFAIYLIHENRPYVTALIGLVAIYMVKNVQNNFALFAGLLALALSVMIVSIIIDKCLSPLWKLTDNIGKQIYSRLKF